jgi:hypothetical protein
MQHIRRHITVRLKLDWSSKTGRLSHFGGKNGPIRGTKPLLASLVQDHGRFRTKPADTVWCHGPQTSFFFFKYQLINKRALLPNPTVMEDKVKCHPFT